MLTGNQNSTRTQAAALRRRSDEDVLQLLLKYRQTCNPELRDRIVMQYTNLVESVARRFAGAAEPVEDLAQEGYIGLITAVDLYDPGKNVKFSTYATHFIIGQIKHYLRDRGKIIKEPAWLQELNQRMARAIEALSQDLSRPPTNLEIACMMDLTEEAVADLMMTREVFKVTSIDGGSANEDDNSGTVNIERRKQTDVAVSFQLPVEDRIVLEGAMGKLKELEHQVVVAFYFRDLNQTEIARQMGISCNYVSHILRNASKKLRKILVTDELRDAHRTKPQIRNRLEEPNHLLEPHVLVDRLTRLYTRPYFETRLDEELSRTSRLGSELAILFIKVAGLANFVHVQGTLKGDEAVLGIVAAIRSVVRRSDIVTRYAEDTFGLILPHTGATVDVVAARLREALYDFLHQRSWHTGRSPLAPGLGWAVYPSDATRSAPLATLAEETATLAVASMPQAA